MDKDDLCADFTSVVAKLEHSLDERFETSESHIGSETSQCSNRTCSIESWENISGIFFKHFAYKFDNVNFTFVFI